MEVIINLLENLQLKLNSFVIRIIIAALSSVAFVALSIIVGFTLSTGRDFRAILTMGSLLLALPFGYCIYRTYLAAFGFIAFGIMAGFSVLARASTANTMLLSLIACLSTALFINAIRIINRRSLKK